MKRLSYTPIDGSECTPFPGAVQVRRARPSRLMGVTIVVRHSLAGKKLDKVDELGARLPRERQYLSREEFREVHGADPADIDIVRRFASKNQLRVVDDDTAARTVELRGTVASFSRAFRLEPLIFRHSTGIFRGYTGPVHVPAELDGVVQAVIGFDTRAQVRRRCVPRIDKGGAWPHAGLSSYNPDQVAKLYTISRRSKRSWTMHRYPGVRWWLRSRRPEKVLSRVGHSDSESNMVLGWGRQECADR